MGYISVTRAVGVRLLFASHGVVSIWRLADVSNDERFWYLAGTLGLLFIESLVTLVKRQGKEWQWYVDVVVYSFLFSDDVVCFLLEQEHCIYDRCYDNLHGCCIILVGARFADYLCLNINSILTNCSYYEWYWKTSYCSFLEIT